MINELQTSPRPALVTPQSVVLQVWGWDRAGRRVNEVIPFATVKMARSEAARMLSVLGFGCGVHFLIYQ